MLTPTLMAAHRVSTVDDFVDQRRHCCMRRGGQIARRYIFMRGSSVFKDADNFSFRKNFAIIQRKHQGFADCKRGKSGNVGDSGHQV